MYYADILPIPTNEQQLWENWEQVWEFISMDLDRWGFETAEEARAGVYPKFASDCESIGLDAIRYRQTDDRGNLLYSYELAHSLLDDTAEAISARRLSPEFLHKWFLLGVCHAALVPSVMALGHDLPTRRKDNLDAHKRWFARQFLRAREQGLSRPAAEEKVERFIQQIVDGDVPVSDKWRTWFRRFLSPEHVGLSNAFRQSDLSERRMKELASLPDDDLAPIDISESPTQCVGKQFRAATRTVSG